MLRRCSEIVVDAELGYVPSPGITVRARSRLALQQVPLRRWCGIRDCGV